MSGTKGHSGRRKSYRRQIDDEIKEHPERIGEMLDVLYNDATKSGSGEIANLYLNRVLGLATAKVQIEAHILTADVYAEQTLRLQTIERNLIENQKLLTEGKESGMVKE